MHELLHTAAETGNGIDVYIIDRAADRPLYFLDVHASVAPCSPSAPTLSTTVRIGLRIEFVRTGENCGRLDMDDLWTSSCYN